MTAGTQIDVQLFKSILASGNSAGRSITIHYSRQGPWMYGLKGGARVGRWGRLLAGSGCRRRPGAAVVRRRTG